MILLADGGSTKVDWHLIDNGKEVLQVFTKGMNPFFRSREEICEEIKTSLVVALSAYKIDAVYFFGAGCANPEKNRIIADAISDNINVLNIEVNSDLLAAARGLCGREKGIACIIGTGSNSCYYNGEKIIENISPLGFILGDEGSGAVLGKLFVGACLKNQLPEGLKEKFLSEFELTPVIILDKVYKQPMPNRFLATITPFILKQIEDETVYNLVYSSFKDFFIKNVMQYDYKSNLTHFTGSVAYHFRHILNEVGRDLDIQIGNITQSPMEGLIRYYSNL